MADQLPIISKSYAVSTASTATASLVGRGLAAIKNKTVGFVRAEQNARYRQARDIYNRITDYGEDRHFDAELLAKQAEPLTEAQLRQLQPIFAQHRQLMEVFTLFQQLADQAYGKVYFLLANMYQGGQGINKNSEKFDFYSRLAFDWCTANQGLNDPEIWRDLGMMYATGRGVAQDEKQAVFWYQKAAEKAYANAQYNLGWMYESGQGVGQDDQQAVFWYRKAAEQGVVNAQWFLAGSYRNGYGVEQDLKQAVIWYRKAAEQHHALAQLFLAGMYAKGLGVAQDDELALFWYRKAAQQGNATAQTKLNKLGLDWQEV